MFPETIWMSNFLSWHFYTLGGVLIIHIAEYFNKENNVWKPIETLFQNFKLQNALRSAKLYKKKVKFILKNSTMYRVHYDKQGTAL